MRRSRRAWMVAGAAAVLFAALVMVAQQQRERDDTVPGATSSPSAEPDESAAAGPGPNQLGLERRAQGDPLAMGAVNAPVVLIEWIDVRCPFCALFSRQTLPTLIDEYIATGLVRYEVRTVEFFGTQSGEAAVAVHAAGEQGMALQYLDAVYAAAPDRGHPDLTREAQIAFAEQIGIPDAARFTADLSRADLRAAVGEETAATGGLGINTVPFFLVGDVAIAGAQPVEVFRDVLDDALGRAQG